MQSPDSDNPYAAPQSNLAHEEPAPYETQLLAERGTRLGARVLDNLLDLGAALPGLIVLLAGGRHAAALGMTLAGAAVLGLNIYQWYLVATTGQTLAKRWLKIQIVRVDSVPLDFVHGVVLRYWLTGVLGMIPTIGGLFGLVNALFIFGEERRCLHDHIAGTKVVMKPYQVFA